MNYFISGKKLKELRKENHYTQQQVATFTNCSLSSVRRWEDSDSLTDINTILTLSKLYKKPMNDLFETPIPQELLINVPPPQEMIEEKASIVPSAHKKEFRTYTKLALFTFLSSILIFQVFFWATNLVWIGTNPNSLWTFDQLFTSTNWYQFIFDQIAGAITTAIAACMIRTIARLTRSRKVTELTNMELARVVGAYTALIAEGLFWLTVLYSTVHAGIRPNNTSYFNWYSLSLDIFLLTCVAVGISLFIRYLKHKRTKNNTNV